MWNWQPENIPEQDTTQSASEESPPTGKHNMSNSEVREDVLDLNLRVMAPHRYFETLNNLRQRVIESSEFFRSRGKYKPSKASSAIDFTTKPSSVSTEIWEHCGALANHDNPRSRIFKSGKNQEDLALELYMKTYFILSRLVDSLDLLSRTKFCGDFYSLLLEHPEEDIAEIIRLPRKAISDFKESLEPVLLESSPETVDQLLKHTKEQCSTILALLSPMNLPATATHSLGQIFWMTAVLLDLALVSYLGSHGLNLGLGMIKGTRFGADLPGLFGFRCQLSRTACLHEFLEKKKIWTFQLFTKSPVKVKGKLSILTRIEEFADLWGPVWAETVSMENRELIKWYTVSNGYICQVSNYDNTSPNVKRCHFYSETSIDQGLLGGPGGFGDDGCLRKDDQLLIGGCLVENDNCTYSIDEFALTYRGKMRYLGTTPATWQMHSRALGISVSKIFGFQIQAVEKLLPSKNLKRIMWDMWDIKNTAEANPSTLNLPLGVEVSHCTGNARRVSLKSLMLSKAVQPLIERWIPGWITTQWGAAFKEALCSDNPDAVVELWDTHTEYRPLIAKVVFNVLYNFHTTGAGDGETEFRAAFLHRHQDMAVDVPKYGNEWAICLGDSKTTAAYVFLNETCLECPTPGYPASICGNSPGYTVLQTQLEFQEQGDLSQVQLLPQGLVLERVAEDTTPQRENILLTIASPTNRILSRLSSTNSRLAGYEVGENMLSPGDVTVGICLQASTKRFGGMELVRRRKSDQPDTSTKPGGSQAGDQSADLDPQEARSEQMTDSEQMPCLAVISST